MKKRKYYFITIISLILPYTYIFGFVGNSGSIVNSKNTGIKEIVRTVSGHVLTNVGTPVVSAVISDGYSVVLSDNAGYYSFTANDSTEFVFISLPEAYELNTDVDGMPLLYARVSSSGDFTHDFILTPFADGGKADSTHVMIGISDPQVRNDYETWRFRNETIKDITELKNSYPAGTHFYGVVVGDLVWDWYDHMNDHKASCTQLGFPVFQVIGNHDHDATVCGDYGADHYFKAAFGPTYYSFNRGKIHYVVLDDIDYIGCNTKDYNDNITQNQINWLTKDLANVPKEKAVVLCVHAPLEGSYVDNRAIVYSLLGGRRTTQHIISGHHHRNTNWEINSRLIDHTLGAAQGAFWSGNYCSDGTPNGYGVFEAGDKGYNNWYYKATGFGKDFQFNVFPVNSVNTGDGKTNCIIANIFNYDSKWNVNIYEDGVKHVMQQYTGYDPKAFDYLAAGEDTRPNYPGSDGGTLASQNPGAETTPHLFSYQPINPNAVFKVEVTDRFGNIYTKPVLHNMMVASFVNEDSAWVYRQDFNTLPSYPNQLSPTTKLAKGTFVQGHTPDGWYACTSGTVLPTGSNSVLWGQFNYLKINNGDQSDGWIYSYGDGNSSIATQNSTERSFGSLVSSTNRCINYGVLLENNTGQTIKEIDIKYVGEMWRSGSSPQTQQKLEFSYAENTNVAFIRDRNMWISQVNGYVVDSLSFYSSSNNIAKQQSLSDIALDGNNPYNRTNVQGKLAVNFAPGSVIMLRWKDSDDLGNDHGLAIDNLFIKANLENPNSIPSIHEDDIKIYVSAKTIYFSQIPNSLVTIYDITGRLIYQNKITSNFLTLDNTVQRGVYIVSTGNSLKKVIF